MLCGPLHWHGGNIGSSADEWCMQSYSYQRVYARTLDANTICSSAWSATFGHIIARIIRSANGAGLDLGEVIVKHSGRVNLAGVFHGLS